MTSAGSQHLREGFIVRLEGDGLHGLGEVAPLANASEEIARLLGWIQRRIVGLDARAIERAIQDLEAPAQIAAAIGCGLDTAACDLIARARAKSVAGLLGGDDRRAVAVNATISAGQPEAAARLARRAVKQGFRCIKLKVGMMGAIGAECELVAAVREAAGADVLIRLDANQAWDANDAIAAIRALENFGLEFVEQPVPAHDLQALAAVRRAVHTPIAADEPVTSLAAAKAIVDAGAADLLVLKPMIVGGLRPASRIIEMAAQKGVQTLVTTTIDSGVGIAAALHLAACLPGELACGLATAELLESVLTSSTPQAHAGYMKCSSAPGLGVEIDELQAAPYLERA